MFVPYNGIWKSLQYFHLKHTHTVVIWFKYSRQQRNARWCRHEPPKFRVSAVYYYIHQISHNKSKHFVITFRCVIPPSISCPLPSFLLASFPLLSFSVFTSFQHSLLLDRRIHRQDLMDLIFPFSAQLRSYYDLPSASFHNCHSKSPSINHRMDELISNYAAVWWWWLCLHSWKNEKWVSIFGPRHPLPFSREKEN